MLLSLSLAGVSRFDRSALGGTTTAAFVGVNAVFGGVVAVAVTVRIGEERGGHDENGRGVIFELVRELARLRGQLGRRRLV